MRTDCVYRKVNLWELGVKKTVLEITSLYLDLDLPALPLIAFNGPIVLFADVETGIYGESWFLEFCQGACG